LAQKKKHKKIRQIPAPENRKTEREKSKRFMAGTRGQSKLEIGIAGSVTGRVTRYEPLSPKRTSQVPATGPENNNDKISGTNKTKRKVKKEALGPGCVQIVRKLALAAFDLSLLPGGEGKKATQCQLQNCTYELAIT